jgi:hypothetical protein
MKAEVEICYDDKTKDKKITVEVKNSLKGVRLLNAVERAVEKEMKDDKDWTRWNLLNVVE